MKSKINPFFTVQAFGYCPKTVHLLHMADLAMPDALTYC
jgi:hypothetical protein